MREEQEMSEQNAAKVRRLYEALNERDLDALDDLVAEDVVLHGVEGQGLNGLKHDWIAFTTSFPDGRMRLEDLVDFGDKVVARNTCEGTNTGEFFGGPPTGRPMSIIEVGVYRFEGGKVVEGWSFTDGEGMMLQLGLAPQESAS
jgi:predicted ester cyclase